MNHPITQDNVGLSDVPTSILDSLTSYGITDLPDPLTVELLALSRPRPTAPADMLAADADALAAYVDTLATWHATRDRAHADAAREVRHEFEGAVRAHLAAREDEIIDALDAAWRPYIDEAKALRAAGVQPNDGAEQLLNHPAEVQQAWKRLRTTANRIADAARVRMHLAVVLHTDPVTPSGAIPHGANWALILTDPFTPDAFTTHDASLTAACLRLADRLGMPHASSVDPLDALTAQGIDGIDLAGLTVREVTD